jgi:Fur family transcriptional regulator, ferric uptake regulator
MGVRTDYVTRPREQIASILRARKQFISAAEIHQALEAAKAKVSLSTVYRTLEHLLSKGDVTVRVDAAGESKYMLCEPEHHHHHAICRACGKVEDVDCTAVEQFSDALRSLSGFELDDHTMEFFGKCKACRANA